MRWLASAAQESKKPGMLNHTTPGREIQCLTQDALESAIVHFGNDAVACSDPFESKDATYHGHLTHRGVTPAWEERRQTCQKRGSRFQCSVSCKYIQNDRMTWVPGVSVLNSYVRPEVRCIVPMGTLQRRHQKMLHSAWTVDARKTRSRA